MTIDTASLTRHLPRRAGQSSSPARAAKRGAWLPNLIALALCLIALGATAWVATTVFDRLPHVEDDVTFLFQAKVIAGGHLLAKPPDLPEFFWSPFILVRDGHWFGKYPPGYPMVLALGVLAGHAWLLNPVAGALDIGLVYLLGRRLYNAATGLLAAALLLVSPFFLLQAGSFMSHTVSLLWALLFLYLTARAEQTRRLWPALGAGVAIGMLFLTRPLTAVGIGLPLALWVQLGVLLDRRRLRLYGLMLAAFLPFVAAILAYNKLTTGHLTEFAYVLWWPYDRIGFGPGHGPEPGGHTLTIGWLDTRVLVDELSRYLYGWPRRLSLVPMLLAAAFVPLGLGRRLARRAWPHPQPNQWRWQPYLWDLLLAGVVVGLIGVHVAYWTTGLIYGPRYYFEAIGAMTLLSARAVLELAAVAGWLLRRALPRFAHPERAAQLGALALLAGLTLWSFNTFTPSAFHAATNWYDINGDGVRQVQAAHLRNALVFVTMQNWTDYAPFFCQDHLTLDDSVVYAIDRGADNQRLMAEYPGRSYYRFDHGTLTRLSS